MLLFLLVEYTPKRETKLPTSLYSINRVFCAISVLALGFASIYMPWTHILKFPLLGVLLYQIEFPWRMLGLASVGLCIVFAISFYLLMPGIKTQKLFVVLCLIFAIINITPLMDDFVQHDDQVIILNGKSDDFINDHVRTESHYFFFETNVLALFDRPRLLMTDSQTTVLSNYTRDYLNLQFDFLHQDSDGVIVELPLYYYPGYQALLDGVQELPLSAGENFIMNVELPGNVTQGTISIRYVGMWYYNASSLVSLGVFMIMIFMYIKRRILSKDSCRI
jgi:hypothetical protein